LICCDLSETTVDFAKYDSQNGPGTFNEAVAERRQPTATSRNREIYHRSFNQPWNAQGTDMELPKLRKSSWFRAAESVHHNRGQ
jgi:hypothetical protein